MQQPKPRLGSPGSGRRFSWREIGRDIVTPDDVTLIPGAAEAVRRLNQAAIKVAVCTNQDTVGRGIIDKRMLDPHRGPASFISWSWAAPASTPCLSVPITPEHPGPPAISPAAA